MKQFRTILKFELKNYFTNKVFVGTTIFMVVLLAVVMFFPRGMAFFKNDAAPEPGLSAGEIPDTDDSDMDEPEDERQVQEVLLLGGDADIREAVRDDFTAGFPQYLVQMTDEDGEGVREKIISGQAACAFWLDGPLSYTYYVDNLSLYDQNTATADALLSARYQMQAMAEYGLTAEEASDILYCTVEQRTETLGKNQMQTYFYTYVMIMALYMAILLYGQMVASGVATEKSSRAMELLITSARPTSMMFGKVLASCIAGCLQMTAVFGSALVFFHLNRTYWDPFGVMASFFDMPPALLGYMLLFFILGFLLYAFMFGAIGSTATKLEDINTSSLPIVLVFVAAFIVVMGAMTSGQVDSVLMKVCSYIPFTSPIAMFTRIAMSTVPAYEILLSVVLLCGSVVGVGILAAKIYRVGVLLYGTPPRLSAILKAVRRS